MSSAPEHLEHIEHAKHGAHSSFDRNVAVTITSLAVLTKRCGFWYIGMVAGIIGVAAGISVLFLH